MPDFYTSFGPLTLQTFTLALALAILASIGIGVYRTATPRGHVIDACLGALALGIIGARAGHVLLNWEHFAYNTRDIPRLYTGGLDWHGALLGGLVGLVLVTHWRRIALRPVLDALTPALPLLALAGWWGCMAANCAFGAEVDTLANYPPLLVAERPDVYGIPAPRYNTQLFGLILSALALGLAALLLWRGWLPLRRFWWVLALLSLGMFGIGFFRADFAIMVRGLRADQWLDLAVLALALAGAVFSRAPHRWLADMQQQTSDPVG